MADVSLKFIRQEHNLPNQLVQGVSKPWISTHWSQERLLKLSLYIMHHESLINVTVSMENNRTMHQTSTKRLKIKVNKSEKLAMKSIALSIHQ